MTINKEAADQFAAQVRVASIAGGKAQRIPKALRDAMEAH